MHIPIPSGESYFVTEQKLLPDGTLIGEDYWRQVAESKGLNYEDWRAAIQKAYEEQQAAEATPEPEE